jgi:hypothetical protein
MPQNCISSCGQFTDPTSLAAFDVTSLCNPNGIGLKSQTDPSWTLNLCGTISEGCSAKDSSTFCAFPDDAVCGIDGEAPIAGMAIRRNFTEPCGLVKCSRCEVAAFPDSLQFDLIDSANPGKGIKGVGGVVPLTPAQRDQRDRQGFCSGGAGRVSSIWLHCDCSKNDQPYFERVWANPDSTCEINFEIYTSRACYDGFCQGLPPPAYRSSIGSSFASWFFFFLVLFGCFYAYARTRSGAGISIPSINLFGNATSRSLYSRFRNNDSNVGISSGNRGRATLFGGNERNVGNAREEMSLDEQL